VVVISHGLGWLGGAYRVIRLDHGPLLSAAGPARPATRPAVVTR
jgi:hypothetical protein